MRPFVVATVVLSLSVLACSPQAPGKPPAAAGDQGSVVVKEWAIEPKSLQAAPGKATFRVRNTGNIEHNFDITGVAKIDSILAGETKVLEVDLAPGTYEVVCSLPGHREAGMVGTLVVSR